MTVLEAIAAWCARQVTFSSSAQAGARDAIIDTLACLYAGRDDFSTQAVNQAWAAYGKPDCRPAAISALINGTAAHAIDFDDNFVPGMSHASAVLVPALLTVALEEDRDGAALIHAYLIGLQAQAFIGDTVGWRHYTAGWHGTSTVGTIGTAAGVAWLKGLDEAGIARAMSIAVSLASGTKGQFGTPVKPFHAGMAARNAIDAAQLARTGMQGRLDIIECEQGFSELFAGPAVSADRARQIVDLQTHVIETAGVLPKRHPCCGSTHMVLDVIDDLRQQYHFTAQEVVTVDTKVGIANWRNLAYPQPEDGMQARFSMQYCVHVFLEKGLLSVADFTPAQVAQLADARQLARITMTPWSAEEEAASPTNLAHIATLTLADGRVLSGQRVLPKGALAEPLNETQRRQKFADCCQQLADWSAVYDALSQLAQQTSLAFLKPILL